MTAASGCGKDRAAIRADAIARGDDAAARNQPLEAITAYRTALEVEPRDGETRLKLERAYRGAHKWSDAAYEAVAAAELLPDNRDAQYLAAWWMLRYARFVDSRVMAAALVKRYPDDAEILLLHACAQANLSSPEVGIEWVERVLREGHNIREALTKLRPPTLQADDAGAKAAFDKAIAAAPDSVEARLGRVSILWAMEAWDEGAAELGALVDAGATAPLLMRTLGLYHEQAARLSDAERYLRGAAAIGDRESRMTLAEYLVRHDRPKEALSLYIDLTGTDDRDHVTTLRAADVEILLGQPAAARARADAVLARAPNHREALRIRARALLDEGNLALAIPAARAAVATAPVSRDARLVLARTLETAGDLSGAFSEYTEAWRSDTRSADVATALARLALALERDGLAHYFAQQATLLDPSRRDAKLHLAQAQARLGDYAGAERTLMPLRSGGAVTPDLLLVLATSQAGRGLSDAARETYLRVLADDPDQIDALTGLVSLEIEARQLVRVRAAIDNAARRHPANPRVQILVARIAAADGRAADAEATLRKILAADAGHVPAALLMADTLARLGRTVDAIGILETARQRQPQSVEIRTALARQFERAGRSADARALYEQILADHRLANPTHAELVVVHQTSARLAMLYADQGTNLSEALQLASSAKRFLSEDPQIDDTLGWVHVRQNRARLGLPYLQRAVKARPADPLFRYHLGAAQEQLGNLEDARAELTRALELDPNFPGSDRAKTLLDRIRR